jgi:hypothetical protein
MTDADRYARELEQAADHIDRGQREVIADLADQMLTLTRTRAPRGETGNYAASWQPDVEILGNDVSVHLFTEEPQAARLEYGFHGRDSRGRVYDVAPQSHQRAAIDAVYPQIKPALTAMVDRALP